MNFHSGTHRKSGRTPEPQRERNDAVIRHQHSRVLVEAVSSELSDLGAFFLQKLLEINASSILNTVSSGLSQAHQILQPHKAKDVTRFSKFIRRS